MTHEDFKQLSPALQREFTLTTCSHLIVIPTGEDLQIELFHSRNGNFFVEFFRNRKRNELLFIKSYCDNHPLNKFLQNIDVSEVYRVLNKRI
jgi:hypothetical protein